MEVEMKNLTIRTAVQSDLPFIAELCRSTSRFISFDEVSTWMQSDPGCFFVAELTSDDTSDIRIVASCCAMRIGVDLGFMALYIVHENYRRRGIGKRIWNRSMERLEGRNIGVKGFSDIFPYYKERYGFGHEFRCALYQCFDGLKLLGEVPSIHGLSFATIFEGQLIKIQNTNGKSGRRSSLDISRVSLTSTNRQNVTATIEDGAHTHANSSSLYDSSEDIDKSSEKKFTHLCKASLETERISENRNVTGSFSNNDESSGSIPLTDYKAYSNCNVTNAAGINMNTFLSSYKDHSAAPPFDVSHRNHNNSVDAITPEKDETIQFGFDYLLERVVDYDRSLHNLDRSFIVRQTSSWKSCRTKIAIANDNTVVGYGCARQCISSRCMVSPLYADSQEIAEILLWELLRDFDFSKAAEGIILCFPEKNTRWADLLKRFGFQDTGLCLIGGYTKECIRLDSDRVYGYHSIDI